LTPLGYIAVRGFSISPSSCGVSMGPKIIWRAFATSTTLPCVTRRDYISTLRVQQHGHTKWRSITILISDLSSSVDSGEAALAATCTVLIGQPSDLVDGRTLSGQSFFVHL